MTNRAGTIAMQVVFILTLFGSLSASTIAKLKEDLFRSYDKGKYPGNVIVQPDVTFTSCPSINAEGYMTYKVKEHYAWNDHRLKWNPQENGDIETIGVQLNSIWVPNIKLSASSTDETVDGLASEHETVAHISSTGIVRVDRYKNYRTRCDVSSERESYYDCSIKFGSMEEYSGETFSMTMPACNSDMFGEMTDQCRTTVVSREKEITTFSMNNSPTTYWFVIKLKLHRRSRFFFDF